MAILPVFIILYLSYYRRLIVGVLVYLDYIRIHEGILNYIRTTDFTDFTKEAYTYLISYKLNMSYQEDSDLQQSSHREAALTNWSYGRGCPPRDYLRWLSVITEVIDCLSRILTIR